MEDYRFEQQKEIVLTYRPGEQVEPVQLSYERELPTSMQPPAPPAEPAWRSAIAPPERRRGRWGMPLFVVLSVLVVLACLGFGLWHILEEPWTPPSQGGSSEGPGQSPWETPLPPEGEGEDDYYEWWYDDYESSRQAPTIPTYPTGGEMRLELISNAGLTALEPGEVYAMVSPSVVLILGYTEDAASVGTGVILSADGYIITNYHVVAGCSECEVVVTDAHGVDTSYEGLMVAGDADKDLAVLKIEAEDLPAAEFGVSDELAIGDKVYAIGNPLGLELRGTFTDGIISAVNRDVDVDGVVMTLLQTNVAINSGNSGGPLINQYGQVVGINVIKMMSRYDTIEGLGFAIPTSYAQRWVNDLIQLGYLQPQPVLGLTISRIPATLPDGSSGLRIEDVTAGLGGDKAGVKVGDYVVAFAGAPVSSTEDILALRRDLYVGDHVDIRVYRDGEYLDLVMEMMEG